MAAIQHKTIEGVVSEYEFHQLPNFSIMLGREPRCSYEGNDMDEGAERLQQYLEMIKDGDSAAVYGVRFYEKGMKINNKAPYKAGTTFMLSERAVTTRDPLTGGFIIERTDRTAGNSNANDFLMKQLIENQNKMFELLANREEERKNDAIGKMIGLLTDAKPAAPEKPDMYERLIELGKMVIDKPEIIDRIGYILRPSAYQQIDPQQALPPQYVNGVNTDKSEPQPMAQTKYSDMTEDQINDSIDNSINTLTDKIGLEQVAEALEKIAAMSTTKLQVTLKLL